MRGALRDAGLGPGSSILVATSGGADSNALLLALHRVAHKGGLILRACYVDHSLRPRPEIEAEQRLLTELCGRLELPLSLEVVDAASARGRRESPEEAARRLRYAALAAVAQRYALGAVATGHTADDQAETVLMRLARGTGVEGLRGVRRVRELVSGGPLLVRPLLRLRRLDTRAYCAAVNAPWSEDSSNASARFRRNRIRHEVLPLLEEIEPGTTVALARLAEQAAGLADLVEQQVTDLRCALEQRDGGMVRLLRPPESVPPYLASALVEEVARGATGASERLRTRIVQELCRLLYGGRGRRLSLPGGWEARATGEGVCFMPARAPEKVREKKREKGVANPDPG